MLTEKVITVPIYKYCLKIVVFDNYQEVADKYFNGKENDCNAITVDYGDKSMMCIPPDHIPTIVHECEHVKSNIWRRIGHITTPENDEVDAYLLEYIFKEAMKLVRKHLKDTTKSEVG